MKFFLALSIIGGVLGLAGLAMESYTRSRGSLELYYYFDKPENLFYLLLFVFILFCISRSGRGPAVSYGLVSLWLVLYISEYIPIGWSTIHVPVEYLEWFRLLSRVTDLLFIASFLFILAAAVPLIVHRWREHRSNRKR